MHMDMGGGHGKAVLRVELEADMWASGLWVPTIFLSLLPFPG